MISTYQSIRDRYGREFAAGRATVVDAGEWQSQDVSDKPEMRTLEIPNVCFGFFAKSTVDALQDQIKPNLPWAEEHFQERVSRVPHNPPPSAKRWPFARKNHEEHVDGYGKFSHTYPERFWPRGYGAPRLGIRYTYGDLGSVIEQLIASPYTRQAYLPIFFPEDTGLGHREKERVPCTLGYHFMIRDSQLTITYLIRSCDFLRHFPDDIYMAARLGQYMSDYVRGAEIPDLSFVVKVVTHIMSLHIFKGDLPMVKHQWGEK